MLKHWDFSLPPLFHAPQVFIYYITGDWLHIIRFPESTLPYKCFIHIHYVWTVFIPILNYKRSIPTVVALLYCGLVLADFLRVTSLVYILYFTVYIVTKIKATTYDNFELLMIISKQSQTKSWVYAMGCSWVHGDIVHISNAKVCNKLFD